MSIEMLEMSSSSSSLSVYVSSELNRQMVNVSQEVAIRAVKECGKMYNFDGEEAVRLLGLHTLKLSRVKSLDASDVKRKDKKEIVKASFPLPFNGEFNEIYCNALRQNNGLYTQCQIARKGDNKYCKSCHALAEKSSDGIPEYGTISQRMAVDIFEYVDPKGRKPVAYKKVMKKYKLSEEQVLEEGVKLNITINTKHFEIQEEVVKRGRPAAAKKEAKEPKGAKGRPKKEKKVLAIEGDGEDLFANLVANAQESDCEEADDELETNMNTVSVELKAILNTVSEELEVNLNTASEVEKKVSTEEKVLAKEQEKALKAQEKALAKEQKIIADKLAKEEKLALAAAEKKEKLALAAAEKEEKLALAAAEKEEKLALAAAKKEPKVVAAKKEPKVVADDEQPDVVKKIEVDGKKYLKSKTTGIIYDYIEYVKNSEQVVVGKWNETKNKIDFTKASDSDEESEDEIEDDDA